MDLLTEQAEDSKIAELIANEVAKRRTFAIISHPDAGKTTLTEKLLLYSGMIRTAGMVRGRKGRKATSSDWMQMEQERGISITASAMQFEYKGSIINVLDTPGHQDFSEDTYRTLTAADCSIMVIDAAKGVETQTRKLFQVCRMRGIPIMTFINKMDLPGRDPLELVHEVEDLLNIHAVPLNWPIGSGRDFRGIVKCHSKEVMLFEKTSAGGAQAAESHTLRIDEVVNSDELSQALREQILFDLELLSEAGNKFERERFLSGEITPVFFGSALTNFGLEPFFDTFIELAPCPYKRPIYANLHGSFGDEGDLIGNIDPLDPQFSAYVFKIQANMNPRHRDSMAFLRICSGIFSRDMCVTHHRAGKSIKLSYSHSLMGAERNTLDAAYAGDIIGVINPGAFQIGDTVSTKGGFQFQRMPQFPPEVVARIRPLDISKRKAFDKAMKQLGDEGAVQVLWIRGRSAQDPLIAAVGRLQFEVVQHRIRTEYNVDTALETLPYNYGSWLVGDPDTFKLTTTSVLAENSRNQTIVLFQSEWEKNYSLERNPDHQLIDFR